MKKYFVYFILFLAFSSYCKAQSNQYKYSTKSEKAIKAYEEAAKQYEANNFPDAIKALDKAIKFDKNFIEAFMMKGDIYADMKKYDSSIVYYKKSIDIDPYFFANNYFNVGMLELKIGRYADAKQDFESYTSDKHADLINKKRAEYMNKMCTFGINMMNNPVPFKLKNMGSNVNSKYNEYLPSVTADEQTLVITRRLPRDTASTEISSSDQEDFYISHKLNDSTWSKALPLGPPINTPGNEGAQCISPDGKAIYFTACERPDGYGSCDLYYSEKIGNTWGVPKNMGPVVNSDKWDSQPSISSDGKTLYFTSARGGGKGNMDIWKTVKDDKGVWGKPTNLGDSINTPGGEMSPFIHPDDQTLYFSSNGHLGMGGFDIFYSRKDSAGNWRKPVNIGYPINTFADESYLIVNSNGDLAYFASDRPGGVGNMDIYTFPLYEKARPTRVNYLKGIVFNEITKEKLKAKFELIDLKTGKTCVESTSDPVNGEFLVCLPTEKDYALNVSKDGYLFYSENFSLTGIHSNSDPFMKNIPLQPIKVGESVVLKNIFFDTDKFELKSESTAELEKLLDLLNKNPKLKIEISGHTDNQGDDKHNQTLSENRAKAVYDYLTNHGIVKERLTYKGYGKTKPIDKNDTEQGRANNRRTEFKVVEAQ